MEPQAISREEYKATLQTIIEDLEWSMSTMVDSWELSDDELEEGNELLDNLMEFYERLDQSVGREKTAREEVLETLKNETVKEISK